MNKCVPTIVAWLGARGVQLSILLAILIFLVGLLDVGLGVVGLVLETNIIFFIDWRPANSGLSGILNGLELLFLAPAVALTFASSVVFLKAKIDRLMNIMDGQGGKDDLAIKDVSNIVRAEVYQVKHSVTGLMIAVLLTDLIGRIISRAQFDVTALAASGVGTGLCLTYYLVLARTHDPH
jgi:hypothetical protein